MAYKDIKKTTPVGGGFFNKFLTSRLFFVFVVVFNFFEVDISNFIVTVI